MVHQICEIHIPNSMITFSAICSPSFNQINAAGFNFSTFVFAEKGKNGSMSISLDFNHFLFVSVQYHFFADSIENLVFFSLFDLKNFARICKWM